MAMGNFCLAQMIECEYATASGRCLDDIYEDFGRCEMRGCDMPPKELPSDQRRQWCKDISKSKTEKTVRILNNLILQATWHGADSGGSYDQNKDKLIEAIEDVIQRLGLAGYVPAEDKSGFILIAPESDLPIDFKISWNDIGEIYFGE